jgi:hypothetical protein
MQVTVLVRQQQRQKIPLYPPFKKGGCSRTILTYYKNERPSWMMVEEFNAVRQKTVYI